MHFVARRATMLLNAHVQSSLRPRMQSGITPPGGWEQEEVEWQESTWEYEEYEASKARKVKASCLSPKASPKARAHRD